MPQILDRAPTREPLDTFIMFGETGSGYGYVLTRVIISSVLYDGPQPVRRETIMGGEPLKNYRGKDVSVIRDASGLPQIVGHDGDPPVWPGSPR